MRILFRLSAVLALAFVLGFFLFVFSIPREQQLELNTALESFDSLSADEIGIVVFTGGTGERIERGLKIYETGRASRVLISGTHPDVRKADLVVTGDRTLIECCVDLGYQAKTTIGNAKEARTWAREKGYKGVILVTSEYHMARSTIELRHAAPELGIIQVPVSSPQSPSHGWIKSSKAWKTLGREYIKFLLAYARSLT